MITRREFVRGVTAASTLGLAPALLAAEPPPETTRIRLVRDPSVCLAPIYVAEDLLQQEGFREVSYPEPAPGQGNSGLLGSGKADFTMDAAPALIMALDAGEKLTMVAGMHVGCYELFASARIKTVRELKGATIAITQERDDRHAFVASFLTHVGLNPRTDVKWATHPADVAMRLLEQGKIDAYLGFAPEPQELRSRKIGHSLLNILTDRPWSQYFCCLLGGNRDFVRKYPVATRRALRALLKANAICAAEPERVNKLLVDRGYVTNARFGLEALREIPYARWRDFDSADTLRFYSLRLREGGMIKSSPDKIIAEGANFRFLDELKKELKS